MDNARSDPPDTSTTSSGTTGSESSNTEQNLNGFTTLIWKARFCFVTFFLADLLQITMVTQYALYRETVQSQQGTANNYFNQTMDHFRSACLNSNLSKAEGEKWHKIETQASLMVTWLNALELLPAVPTVIFLGLWSDVTQRMILLMWLPCLGNAIYSFALLLDYLINVGDWVLYTGATISGFCGGPMLFFSGCASLLAHTATKEQLTFNVSFLEIAASFSLSIGSITVGYLLQLTGFTAPLSFLLAVSVLALFANAFLVSEVKPPLPYSSDALQRQVKAICNLCRCSVPWSTIMIVYFFNFQLIVFVHLGQERTNVLFLEMEPLCFDAALIGWWLFTEGLLEGIGTFLAVKLLFKYLDDSGLCFLGYASRAAACICIAFSTTKTVAFVALIFMSLQRLPLSAIRSALSKITDLDKQGSVFGLLHSGEAVTAFLGPLCFNVIFTTTVSMVPNPVYITATAVTVFVAFFTCGSIYLRRKYKVEDETSEYLALDG